MATHSSVLAWKIPGTGEPGGLPSMGVAQSRTRLKRLSSSSSSIHYHSKGSRPDKDKIICYLESLKNDTNELIYKTEIDSESQEKNLHYQSRGKFGINIYTALYIK